MGGIENAGAVPAESAESIARQLAKARQLCETEGERVSAPRLRTLELVLAARGPVKAYDLAERFHGDGAASAITIYRALKFWERMGLVRRVATLNAFIASSNREVTSNTVAFLCTECGARAEIPVGVPGEIETAALALGFDIERLTLEAGGRCRRCAVG